MKILKKNFQENRFSVESMATLATCNCSKCGNSGVCQCSTVSDYGGFYYDIDGAPYASVATGNNVLING